MVLPPRSLLILGVLSVFHGCSPAIHTRKTSIISPSFQVSIAPKQPVKIQTPSKPTLSARSQLWRTRDDDLEFSTEIALYNSNPFPVAIKNLIIHVQIDAKAIESHRLSWDPQLTGYATLYVDVQSHISKSTHAGLFKRLKAGKIPYTLTAEASVSGEMMEIPINGDITLP